MTQVPFDTANYDRISRAWQAGIDIIGTTKAADALMTPRFKQADAEKAKKTGGMIALTPRLDYAQQLAVPGGETVEDIHCTLVFLGEDIDTETFPFDEIGNGLQQIADAYGAIPARVFGQAIFNPDGDPAAVYLLNDVKDGQRRLDNIHYNVLHLANSTCPELHEQHTPWVPHLTVSYGYPGIVGSFTGEIVFDHLSLHVAGQVETFRLL